MSHILVVEDDPSQAALIAGLLRHEGFAAESSDPAARALIQPKEGRPDVVLLDIGLPDLNGVERAGSAHSQLSQ